MHNITQRACLAVLFVAAASPGLCQTTAAANSTHAAIGTTRTPAIRMRFVDTDVSDVLQALTVKTHANVVYPAQLKKPVSLNIAAGSVDEALAYVTAAAGLVFKRVGSTYVVAQPADLRQALEPFGEHEDLRLHGFSADAAVKLLSGAFPYLTVRPAGTSVALTGAQDDIDAARSLLEQQEAVAAAGGVMSFVQPVVRISASQTAKLLASMYPELKVESIGDGDKPGGAVGLTGPKDMIDSARSTIGKLDADQAGDRVWKIYDVKYATPTSLVDMLTKSWPSMSTTLGPERKAPKAGHFTSLSGVLQQAAGSTGGSGGSGGGGQSSSSASGQSNGSGPNNDDNDKPGERARQIVLSGSAADVDAAMALLEKVDIAPKQVVVSVMVVDTSPEQASDLGITWDWNPLQFVEGTPGTPVNADGSVSTPTLHSSDPGSFGRIPWAFNATLHAMVTNKTAKILADPSIQVTDNDDANIFIGDTIRSFITSSSISGTTNTLVEFPVGIILLVRPRISGDGNITMRVHPEVSTVSSLGPGGLPQTSSREAETTVMVKDGETVVIGGLIRDEMSKTITEVPILSKIPIIGELFRNRSTDHRHSEILVFITPHIVGNTAHNFIPGDAPRSLDDPRVKAGFGHG